MNVPTGSSENVTAESEYRAAYPNGPTVPLSGWGFNASTEPMGLAITRMGEMLAAADALADAVERYGLPGDVAAPLRAYRRLRNAPETAHSAILGEE